MILPEKIEQVFHSEYYSMFKKELNDIMDLQLLLIKGHLLIEFAINKAIEKFSKGKPKIRFTFYQKLAIVQMFGLFNSDVYGKIMLDTITTINDTRNKFAHKLEIDHNLLLNEIFTRHPEFTEHLKNTIAPHFDTEPDVIKIYVVLMYVCTKLYDAIEAMVEINNAISERVTKELRDEIDRRLWEKNNYWFKSPISAKH